MQFLKLVCKRNRFKLAVLLLLFVSITSFFVFHAISMLGQSLTYAKDGSDSLGVFVETSKFLLKNLKQNETALVPMSSVFHALIPELRDNLVDYTSFWASAGVILNANTTNSEVIQIRNRLIGFLKENPHIKYVVRDWIDPYAWKLYDANVNDELWFLIRETRVIPFSLSTGWSNKITIYERVQYTALFAIDFSVPLLQSFISPQGVLVQSDSEGTTIHKEISRVGFYLPLDEEINASKQSYLTIQFKLDVENLQLQLTFYYDRNRDGKWSGYDIEYVQSATFNQSTLGWATGEWRTIYQVIPQADEPVVQIGIILSGDNSGSIAIKKLAVYSEEPS